MASNMPLPVPITLSSPSPISERRNFDDFGLGIQDSSGKSTHQPSSRLSLSSDSLTTSRISQGQPILDNTRLSPQFPSPRFSDSYGSPGTTYTADSTHSRRVSTAPSADDNITFNNPFNFTTQQYTAIRPVSSRELGKRKGHKYKHSSVSHQIFLEPPQRAPLSLPASLPTPTRVEVQKSMSSEQKFRLAWCACHFLVAAHVQWSAHGSLAMTALSRLLFFDAIGAVICVAVDVMANFEVWKRSSLKHPFGLERVDVLAGFGLAVFVAFMGLDVLSHGIEHTLANFGDHASHHGNHAHTRVSLGSVDIASLLAIIATLISALLLRNHVRIGKAMRLGRLAGWTPILSNPSHFMTLSCSALLLLLPLFSVETYAWFDAALSLTVAVAMVAFGARLGTSLAPMLLMSYSGSEQGRASVRDVIYLIETNPDITGIDEARFWQVHYGLCMANLRLRYAGGGYGDDAMRLREHLTSVIRNRLSSAYGSGGLRWEISIQLALDKE